MNSFEQGIAQHIGRQALEKIQEAHVGIAGAGGLGSNCAVHLTRSGFKRFTIVDFDLVEWSNLNRQFYFGHQVGKPKIEMLKDNLLAINPDLDLNLHQCKLDSGNIKNFFQSCDVVVEAFDRAEDKKMIIEAYLPTRKLVVAASGLAGWGSSDAIQTHQLSPTFYVIGDLVSEVSPDCPPVSPRVNITAAKQADIILEYILNRLPADSEPAAG